MSLRLAFNYRSLPSRLCDLLYLIPPFRVDGSSIFRIGLKNPGQRSPNVLPKRPPQTSSPNVQWPTASIRTSRLLNPKNSKCTGSWIRHRANLPWFKIAAKARHERPRFANLGTWIAAFTAVAGLGARRPAKKAANYGI